MTPPKRRGYSNEFPCGKTRCSLTADKVPVSLKKATQAFAKKRGISVRTLVLQQMAEVTGWKDEHAE